MAEPAREVSQDFWRPAQAPRAGADSALSTACCANCGAEFALGARFCHVCGAPARTFGGAPALGGILRNRRHVPRDLASTWPRFSCSLRHACALLAHS